MKLEDLEAFEKRVHGCYRCTGRNFIKDTEYSEDCLNCMGLLDIDEIAGLLEWTRQLLEYWDWSVSANHCSSCKSGRQCQRYVNTADEQRINCPLWVAGEQKIE